MHAHDTPLTQLLALAAQGERAALDRVFEALYPDLRRIAHARLRGASGSVALDTTALVHESFLRLVDSSALVLADRRHFFAYAAKTMRNIIIDFAREHLAERRGGGAIVLPLDTQLAEQLAGQSQADDEALVRIHDALLALEAAEPTLAQVVEMRYFAGYSVAEVAALTDTSERTVQRQWEKARAFLMLAMRE